VIITEIRTHSHRRTGLPEYGWREGLARGDGSSDDLWVQVCTDAGIDGWAPAEYYGPYAHVAVERSLRDLAVGQDPLLKEHLAELLWDVDRIEMFPIYVLGILDIACWDITGKAAGLPVWQLLGGYRDRVPAYASTATFGSVQEYLDVADQCLDAGFRGIKLHAWGDARRDAQLSHALRSHVGDEIELMYDGSAAFGYPDALYLGRALEDAGFAWYEEPLREYAVGLYRRLADKLDIPILGAEVVAGGHHAAAEWLSTGACDLIRTGVDFKGGISGAIKIAHLASAFGTTAEVHGGGAANLHVAAASPNCPRYESMVLTNPIQVDPLVVDGEARVPGGPGIGWVLPEWIELP
jgi:L-alanine-DL-glutamate epimerase-like enolase superfamily enzyme